VFCDPNVERFDNIQDHDYLADMLIPLNLVEAAERLESFGVEPHWADEAGFDWAGRYVNDPTRRLMTCRHFDEETRLCGAYDSRPQMCRNYPYTATSCDYGCGYSLSFQERYEYALGAHGIEEGTPPNVVRGYN
jgi:Fe-S-cluster containining protein